MMKSPKYTEDQMEEIVRLAFIQGRKAGESALPTPMNVVELENPLATFSAANEDQVNDSSKIVRRYPTVTEGACGFAWVIIRPGNSRFARYLKEQGIARPDSYHGGVCIWIGEFGQSVERKEEMARAMEKVFRDNGIYAIAMSRLD